MQIHSVTALFYSATGNTRKLTLAAADAVSEALGSDYLAVEYARPDAREVKRSFAEDDLLVIGFPTYRSKLPLHVTDGLDNLSGNGTPAIVVISYGNRSYADSIAQMVSILRKRGFVPVAAAAYPSRHAYSDLVGTGRPNEDDIRDIRDFALQALDKISSGMSDDLTVPGDADAPLYVPLGTDGKPVSFLHARPKVKVDLCTRCGLCARLCPLGSVDKGDPSITNGDCFKCQACIRGCPVHARYFDDAAFLSHVRQLEINHSGRKEIEHFL